MLRDLRAGVHGTFAAGAAARRARSGAFAGLASALLILLLILPTPAIAAAPILSASPTSGTVGQTIATSGTGFPRKITIRIAWDGSVAPVTVRTSNRGTFQTSVDVPALVAGGHQLVASLQGGATLASVPFTALGTTPTPTVTPTPTPTPIPTSTPTPTANPTPTPTPTPTLTPIPTPTPTLTPTPNPTPTPSAPGQKVVSFGPSGTQAQFQALMGDMTVDVIEIQAGTYSGWHVGGSGMPVFAIDRSARPLLVRPAPNAAVIWDGAGVPSGDGWFYAGHWTPVSTITSSITFDPAGTGGSFTIQNYALGQQGLVSTYWTDRVAFNGFHTKGITGLSGGSTSWDVYVSSDGTHAGSNLTFNSWVVDASAGRNVSAFQTYHDPQVKGLTVHNWNVTGSHIAILSWGTVTGADISGWTITNCDYPVSTDGVAAGVLKYNTATGSAYGPIIKSPFVDGGGNSWH